MRRITWILVVLLAGGVLAAAGCGGDDDNGGGGSGASSAETETPTAEATETATEEASGGGGGGETLSLAAPADGTIAFDKTELKAKAGKVTIKFDNPASIPHAVEVEGNGVEEETDTITQGKAELTVDLKAGEYEYYCPVDGHRAQGMEGKLTVK